MTDFPEAPERKTAFPAPSTGEVFNNWLIANWERPWRDLQREAGFSVTFMRRLGSLLGLPDKRRATSRKLKNPRHAQQVPLP